ncbi:glycosyltransferase [Lactobacillus reuteri]|uniref:Glycosyltransferase n=1 Tax=Limosilactobacillus reuteri TaxID=1598 RepID=A0A6L5P6H6_LIMRT|nr:glycosyltransferase [Limosilactobacillus reuteri]MRH09918.1 glycosyltransferase [Limosilactobacillus reuteri]
MKIAMIVDGLNIGGIEKVCIDYTKLLLQLGHQVTVINLNPRKNSLQKDFPTEVKIKKFNFSRNLCGERYAQLIKRGSSGKYIYPFVYTSLKFVELEKKLEAHTKYKENYDLAIAFSGHFNDLTFVADNFLRARYKLAWMHGALYGYLLISDGYYNLYKKIKNLVCLVDDAQDEALVYNHDKCLNIYKLYNPTSISSKVVNEKKVQELKDKYGKFLIMVSRFEYPHKDHYTVCRAFEILRSKIKEPVNLLFIGDGPEEKKVREFVNSLPKSVSEHIYFLGKKDDVQNYYKAAYIMVHASVAGEGLPTVQLEALSYGLPQVVTDSKVGPREILGDNKYGLLAEVKNPNDMANKIKELLDNQSLYKYYRNVSAERMKDFLPNTIKIKLDSILNEIVKKN